MNEKEVRDLFFKILPQIGVELEGDLEKVKKIAEEIDPEELEKIILHLTGNLMAVQVALLPLYLLLPHLLKTDFASFLKALEKAFESSLVSEMNLDSQDQVLVGFRDFLGRFQNSLASSKIEVSELPSDESKE